MNWIHFEHTEDIINELENILIQEFISMEGLCATGHLSRLINVTQGYTDEFIINISLKEQANSVIRTYLTNKLKNCQDENVIDGITSSVKSEYFLTFIDNCIIEKLNFWEIEYGLEFITYVEEIVTKYKNII